MAFRRKTKDRDFTGGALPYFYQRRGSTGKPEFDARVTDLVKDWGCTENNELVEELIITALKIATDRMTTGDLKLLNRAVRELREANRTFQPYNNRRKIVVYGSARTHPDKAEAQAAELFGRKIREAGFMVITGAGDGIMGAAQKGAGREESFGLNIKLPFEQSANDTIDGDRKLVSFNYFFTRKLTFVKEAEGFALFPGGYGTMDELFEVLTLIQTGKAGVLPIVMVDVPGGTYWAQFVDFVRDELLRPGLISEDDLSLFKITDSVDEAVAEIARFYRVFHSYRYAEGNLVLRLNEPLSTEKLEKINTEYRELLASGDFTATCPLAAEASEPELADLPRIVFKPQRRNSGLLRRLIDEINAD